MAFGGETAESYYDEGLTASMRGDLACAVKNFEKAIRLDSTMASAYYQLGKCYLRLGDGAAAANLLNQVVRKRPDQEAPRIDLGFALIGLGKPEEARHQFDQVLAMNPVNGRALLGLAHVEFSKGDWDAAVAQAQAAIVQSGPSFPVLFVLGRAARLAGNPGVAANAFEKADKLLEKSLEVNPNQPEAIFFRGEISFAQENFAAALDHFRSAQDHAKPDRRYSAYGENFSFADILAKQGLCLERLGRIERAREIGERIGELDPEHSMGKYLRES